MSPEEALATRDEFRALLGADYINGTFIFDIIAKTYPGETQRDDKKVRGVVGLITG